MSNERLVDSQQAQRLEAAGFWLIRLQEDVLTEAEMSDWIEWCEHDPKNLEAFDHLHALWQSAAVQLPAAARKPLLHARVPLWGALAASVVLMLAVSAIFLAIGQWPASGRIADRDLVQTPVALNQPATLPDGSHLEIGGRSSVAVDFTAAARRLQLREGEAFFQVRHDTVRPFVVEVADLRIVAVGTAFNVRRAGTQVAVTVQEGMVEVSRSAAGDLASIPGDAEPMRVVAGRQLVVDVQSGKVRESLIDPEVALAWRSGRLEFTGDSLDTVVASVNRYAARPITLADPQLGELTFTGTVFFESIDAWLDGLQQVFPVAVDRSHPGEILLTRRPPQI